MQAEPNGLLPEWLTTPRRLCGWLGMARGESGRRGWPLSGPGGQRCVILEGSGRAGGQCRVGGAEWIDRWFADEEAQDLADLVSLQS